MTRLLLVFGFLLISAPAAAQSGMVSVLSQNGVPATVKRLEQRASALGMKVLMKFNPGKKKPDTGTQLLLLDAPTFYNALTGASASVGVELPLKISTHQDPQGQVWITYADPRSIAARHRLSDFDPAEKMADLLAGLTMHAAAGPASKKQ